MKSDSSSPLKISRILHAGYVLDCGGIQIAFDPIFENPFSRNCYAFPAVRFDQTEIKNLKFSAVFISHYHDDHCSLESLNFLNRETPIYIYCLFEELAQMIRELGFSRVYQLEIDRSVQVGPFEVSPRRALDVDVDSIFQVKAAGLNILNVVDSWIDPETLNQLAAEKPWDLILWPFQTMRELEVLSPSRAEPAPSELPPEWIGQLRTLDPRYLVPSSCQFQMESWSWYNHAFFPISYRQFEQEIGQVLSKTQIVRMNPGMSFVLEPSSMRPADRLSWVVPIGEQNLDYEYTKGLRPPATSEIARHFSALSESQNERVINYCRQGLLEKYRSLGPPLDEYFEKPRIWKLSLFDHNGFSRDFHYQVSAGEIMPVEAGQGPLAWLTEVPISKLRAALELGESLTSMYLRINDIVFEPEIEREIQTADLLEDPLIRCLFNGVFGAYQAAQLKRLQKPNG